MYNGKNKTFFFFNWEEINDHGVQTPTAKVPTALQKSGDFSQTFTSSGALITDLRSADHRRRPHPRQRLQQVWPFRAMLFPPTGSMRFPRRSSRYYPDPTLAISPTLQANWSANFGLITHQNKYFTRVDQNFGEKNRLFFRYGYQTSPRTSPYGNIAFPGETTNGGGNQESIAYTYGLSDTHTFSPNLVGEFRLGYTRSIIKLTPLSVGFDITTLGLPALSEDCIRGRHLPVLHESPI